MEEQGLTIILPAKVLKDKRLNPNEKLLLGFLKGLACVEELPVNGAWLAEEFGVTRQAANIWLHKLEKCGYLALQGRKNIKKNYKVTIL